MFPTFTLTGIVKSPLPSVIPSNVVNTPLFTIVALTQRFAAARPTTLRPAVLVSAGPTNSLPCAPGISVAVDSPSALTRPSPPLPPPEVPPLSDRAPFESVVAGDWTMIPPPEPAPP